MRRRRGPSAVLNATNTSCALPSGTLPTRWTLRGGMDAPGVRVEMRVSDALRHQDIVPAGTIDIGQHADRDIALPMIESVRVLAGGHKPLQAPQHVGKEIDPEQASAAEIVVRAEPDRPDPFAARLTLQGLHQQRPAAAALMRGVDHERMQLTVLFSTRTTIPQKVQ